VDKPREVIRIERDYSSGTGIAQFWAGWIWELEGRVSRSPYSIMCVRGRIADLREANEDCIG